jgi:hypothetical protein
LIPVSTDFLATSRRSGRWRGQITVGPEKRRKKKKVKKTFGSPFLSVPWDCLHWTGKKLLLNFFVEVQNVERQNVDHG